MSEEADLVIRNGTIFDGTGGAPYRGAIAVKNGVIVETRHVTARG